MALERQGVEVKFVTISGVKVKTGPLTAFWVSLPIRARDWIMEADRKGWCNASPFRFEVEVPT
jgi:hypothetical protein